MTARTLAAAAALLLGATACSGSDSDPEPGAQSSSDASTATEAVEAPALAISAPDGKDGGAVGDLSIGLVVSLSSAPGEGSAWVSAASGAQVAAYRYQLADQGVDLQVVDDQGTTQGFTDAVAQLSSAGVSGIVAATSGRHVTEALAQTAPDVPVLLPYETDADGLPDDVWLTGPSAEQESAAMTTALRILDVTDPYVVTTPQERLPGFDTSEGLDADAGATAKVVLRAIGQATKGDDAPDAVVLALPAETAAGVVKTLQGTQLDLPVVVGREAVSPSLGAALQDAGASTAAELFTVGTDTSDSVLSLGGAAADRATPFFTALQTAASDPAVTGLFDEGTLADTAGSADIASHDAVVALVSAARLAGSADPADVSAALSGLALTGDQGLAGPDLDFSDTTALADDAVVPLQSTDQPLGARPATAADPALLSWFPLPDPS